MEEGNLSMETEALRSVIHTGSLFERIVGASRLAGGFVCYIDLWQEILKNIIKLGNFVNRIRLSKRLGK